MQVSVIAGNGGVEYFVDGQGTQAHFSYPYGVAVDGDGNIIVADMENRRIRKIDAGLAPPLTMAVQPAQQPSAFVAEMEALLNDESLSDMTFAVGDERIPALSNILVARSQYFRAMLTSGFREGQEPPYKRARTSGQEEAADITIGDTTPEAFRALLRYLYTDELCFADEQLLDVMRKAKEISLDRVYSYGVRRVRQTMSVHNVVAWLVKADEYGLEDVRTATFGFLARNLRKVEAQVWIADREMYSEIYLSFNAGG